MRKTFKYHLISCLATVVLFVSSNPSWAAFCSLRDPILAIQHLYPNYNRYRSIVRPIDREVRNRVSQRLPFTLHYNEIGKHTLYLISENDSALGFVQARSELSDWGLIEIAWAITPELTIKGLDFQRCRSPQCNDDVKSQIQSAIGGMSFQDLVQLINADGSDLTDNAKSLFPQNRRLHLTIVRSALKTLAVTELAWGDIVSTIQFKPSALSLAALQ